LEYFYNGLDLTILEKIFTMSTVPATLQATYEAAARLDTQLRRIQNMIKGHRGKMGTTAIPKIEEKPVKKEPTSLGIGRLTTEQRQDYMKRGLCFRCGKPGHRAGDHKGNQDPSPGSSMSRKPVFN
jgi:hypothetical protein